MEKINYARPQWHEEKFGANADLGATAETVWEGGGVYPWKEAAESLEVLGVAGDTSVELRVDGLDANYALQSANVTTDASDGTTPVALPGTWMRVFRMRVTSGITTGTITLRVVAGETRAVITHPNYQTLMAIFTVPLGHFCMLSSYYLSAPKGKDAIASLFVRPFGEEFQLKHQITVYESKADHTFGYPMRLGEKSDIDLRATGSGAGQKVHGGFALHTAAGELLSDSSGVL